MDTPFLKIYFYLSEEMEMTVINTNIAATVAANAMRENSRAMENTMERLATGKRINSASDDAAGLAIGARMEAQVRGLSQATRNANDAISLLQTVDGAAVEIGDMLQRMRELAVQANNGTNETNDITNLNKEFSQLASEIDRIANDTKFNGSTLMHHTSGVTKTFVIGADQADTVSVTIADYNLGDGGAQSVSASAGTKTIAVALADLASALESGGNITLGDATTTISIDLGDVQAAHSGGGTITSSNVTQAQIATALTAAANTSTAFTATVTANASTDLIMTEKSGVEGGNKTYTFGGYSDLTAKTGAVANGTAGSASGVLGQNFSAYGASGSTSVTDGTVITYLDAAIVNVAAARADYGSVINRLEHTIDNLNSSVLNTKSAKSAIVDADYAAETTELARTQIISQASTAMLSQANQQAQSVLALLK